jgi:hypothetical protein
MARREERISQGVEDLERWLQDFVRAGLAEAAARPWSSFEQMSARLVDAQAPGLARFVRDLGSLPHSTTNWPERMLIDVGQLTLLISAWRRLDLLEPDLRAEIRALVGINEARNDVLATPPVQDTWDVVGRRSLAGERMLVQRTWLWGRRTRRWALVLEFAMAGQLVDERLTPGLAFEGGLHFYAGAVRLRALFGEPPTLAGAVEVQSLPTQSVQDLLRTYAEWLGRNPWLERMPAALSQVVPQRGREDAWWLGAADGRQVPLSGPSGWQLLALSGGAPIDVVGEWDGFALWPLAARDDARLVPMRVAPLLAPDRLIGMSARASPHVRVSMP